MPTEILYGRNNGIIIKASGRAFAQDLIDKNNKLYSSDEAIRWLKYQIIDLSEIEVAHITIEELQQIARQDNMAITRNPHILFAIVVNQHHYKSLVKVWQEYVQHEELKSKIFNDIEDALEWVKSSLGLKE